MESFSSTEDEHSFYSTSDSDGTDESTQTSEAAFDTDRVEDLSQRKFDDEVMIFYHEPSLVSHLAGLQINDGVEAQTTVFNPDYYPYPRPSSTCCPGGSSGDLPANKEENNSLFTVLEGGGPEFWGKSVYQAPALTEYKEPADSFGNKEEEDRRDLMRERLAQEAILRGDPRAAREIWMGPRTDYADEFDPTYDPSWLDNPGMTVYDQHIGVWH